MKNRLINIEYNQFNFIFLSAKRLAQNKNRLIKFYKFSDIESLFLIINISGISHLFNISTTAINNKIIKFPDSSNIS